MMISATTAETLIALPPRPEAAHMARRELVGKGLDEDITHTVTLLTTELIANAVFHAGMDADEGRIILFARMRPDHVRVEVGDTGRGFDPQAPTLYHGFGLRLLGKLASRWGCGASDQGFRVWFEVDRRRRRFGRSAVS